MYSGGVLAANKLRAGGAGPNPFGATRKCAITIDHTLVGSTLTDFPFLCTLANLPSEMFDSDGPSAQADGGDIRFSSDSAGSNRLACDIRRFSTDSDPANGTAVIWVLVPSVSSSSDTTIYVWYNTASTDSQPAADAAFGAQAVWADELAHYHLDEGPNTTSGGYKDAVGDYDATGVSTALSNIAGPFGNLATDLDGSADYIGLPTALGFRSWTAFTIKGWANADDLTSDERFVHIRAQDSVTTVIDLWLDSGGAGDGWAGGTGSGNIGEDTNNGTTDWQFVAYVYDGSNHYIYVAGAESASAAKTGTVTPNGTTQMVRIGRLGSGTGTGSYFNGGVCEVAFLDVARSADWIAAEYANQSAPGTFASAGTPEAA